MKLNTERDYEPGRFRPPCGDDVTVTLQSTGRPFIRVKHEMLSNSFLPFSLCRETTLLFFGFLFLYGLATLVSIYSGETLLRRLLRGIATRIHNIIYKLVMVVVVIIITVFIVIEDKAFSVVVVSVRTTTPVGDVDLAG